MSKYIQETTFRETRVTQFIGNNITVPRPLEARGEFHSEVPLLIRRVFNNPIYL